MAHKTPHEKWQIWNDPEEALRRRESLIEQQIRAAQSAGAFDNLPGYGKPLPRDRDQDIAGESWISNRVLKQAGFVPEWVRLRKEIAADRPAVSEALSAYRAANRDDGPGSIADLDQLERHYITLAIAINQKIDAHNGQCPPGQILIRFVEDATRRWN
jgi:DnaJ homolog subfamily C member 28